MGENSSKPKGAACKVGRMKRKGLSRRMSQWTRSARNKLARINRDRRKANKPPLLRLPAECRDHRHLPS